MGIAAAETRFSPSKEASVTTHPFPVKSVNPAGATTARQSSGGKPFPLRHVSSPQAASRRINYPISGIKRRPQSFQSNCYRTVSFRQGQIPTIVSARTAGDPANPGLFALYARKGSRRSRTKISPPARKFSRGSRARRERPRQKRFPHRPRPRSMRRTFRNEAFKIAVFLFGSAYGIMGGQAMDRPEPTGGRKGIRRE